MEYCSHLWAGTPQYQLDPFDRIQRRTVRIVGDWSVKGMTHWLCVTTASRCALSTAFVVGNILGNYLTCNLSPNSKTSSNTTTVNLKSNKLLYQFAVYKFIVPSFHQVLNKVLERKPTGNFDARVQTKSFGSQRGNRELASSINQTDAIRSTYSWVCLTLV